jgi:hypothetical protein
MKADLPDQKMVEPAARERRNQPRAPARRGHRPDVSDPDADALEHGAEALRREPAQMRPVHDAVLGELPAAGKEAAHHAVMGDVRRTGEESPPGLSKAVSRSSARHGSIRCSRTSLRINASNVSGAKGRSIDSTSPTSTLERRRRAASAASGMMSIPTYERHLPWRSARWPVPPLAHPISIMRPSALSGRAATKSGRAPSK